MLIYKAHTEYTKRYVNGIYSMAKTGKITVLQATFNDMYEHIYRFSKSFGGIKEDNVTPKDEEVEKLLDLLEWAYGKCEYDHLQEVITAYEKAHHPRAKKYIKLGICAGVPEGVVN